MTDKLAQALRELIACKDLKEQIESDALSLQDHTAYVRALRDDYNHRKPLAWEAARAALAEHDAAQAVPAMSREVRMAVMLAYGHLWHVNDEPAAPIPLYPPERAAYAARLQLRDLLTTQERGEAISQVGVLIGRYDSPPEGGAA